jgi:roadblock/LC7 domain-containing protein
MADQVPVPPTPPPVQVPVHEGPVVVELERGYEVHNWRPLVNWLLAIPQWIVLYVLSIVAGVLWVISFFTVLFTRRNPFLGVQTMIFRYEWRVITFAGFMRNEYPPFDFATTPGQEAPDPAVLTIEDPGEMNRWLPLIKWLLVIPHLIVLTIIGIGVLVVHVIAFFAVLFTGRWPEGLRDFVVGYFRWTMRVNAYFYFLTDVYPPFSLQ